MRDLLSVAQAAVAAASDLIQRTTVGQVEAKGERDMVTNVDRVVEQHVREFLARETPEVGFFGEEGGRAGRTTAPLQWVLDPVDGTANLAHKIPLCGVSLGLMRGEEAVLGVIDLPFLRERYEAARGLGATANGQRLRVRPNSDLGEAIVGLGDYAVGEQAAKRNEQRLVLTQLLAAKVLRVRMLGSAAIDLAWVASGQLDACVALSNHLWDVAAGVAIAREAGAAVIDIDGTPHTPSSRATIAVTPGLERAFAELLRPLRNTA
ncbi:inositol monophosphatase family protein [Streptomyces sp. NPDC058861]|uniref:inositol monophosphatase family protein n=1 Tax=Streptomyces sp. NPDC058861 TaxID=3346653 RepID=UPI0036BFEDF3